VRRGQYPTGFRSLQPTARYEAVRLSNVRSLGMDDPRSGGGQLLPILSAALAGSS
jgi:hypothetical protein